MVENQLFGTRARTVVLLCLAALTESYAAEIARLGNVHLTAVRRSLDQLENEAIIVGRVSGRERRYSMNPHYANLKELKALLLRLADSEPEFRERLAATRRRPRRRNKPL